MSARRVLLTALVLAAFLLVLLNGCVAMPDDWQEYPTKRPLLPSLTRLSAAEVTRICGPQTMGCVKRDYANGVCVIYTEHRPLPETIPHELLHCAGFEHDPK